MASVFLFRPPSPTSIPSTSTGTRQRLPSAPHKSKEMERIENLTMDDFESTERCTEVRLHRERISSAMAARLSVSLLGHVLFLKSQVPFPVSQLMKMAERGTVNENARTAKKQDELLDAFDLLSSHLATTFTSLSTALAKHATKYPVLPAPCPASDNDAPRCSRPRRKPATVHMFLVLGPSISTSSAAKARILLEFKGFDLRIWGERYDIDPRNPDTDIEDNDDHDTSIDESTEDSFNATCLSDDEDHENAPSDALDQDFAAPPPLSRSPTPCFSSSSSSSSSGSSSTSEDSESESEFSDGEEELLIEEEEESEMDLRAAERLFSRALASANAEVGLSSEIPPTQTHVLLHAPRRFDHPSWLPKQNLAKTMDKVLENALQCCNGTEDLNSKKWKTGGVKTECIRVSAVDCPDIDSEEAPDENNEALERDGEESEDNEDEMIWWAWDGKLVGFSDW